MPIQRNHTPPTIIIGYIPNAHSAAIPAAYTLYGQVTCTLAICWEIKMRIVGNHRSRSFPGHMLLLLHRCQVNVCITLV